MTETDPPQLNPHVEPGLPDDLVESEFDTESRAPKNQTTPKVYKGTGMRWSFLLGILLVVLMLIVMFQNFQTVTFDFLSWSVEAPLAVIILGASLIAVIVAELIGVIWRYQRRRQRRAMDELKELKQSSKESGTG